MDETKAEDMTQHASSTADPEQKFRHTIRHGSKIQICRAILYEFFTDSSILGFKYFCDRKRHWSERIFWMIMFGIATGFSGHMIYELYDRWDQSPVIVTFSETATPVWEVPFPAVTICPEVKISSKMLNLTRTLHMIRDIKSNQSMLANITEQMKNHLAALQQICDLKMMSNLPLENDSARLIQDLNHIALKLNAAIVYCSWRHKNKNCSDLFRPILTEEGVCFTFNSLNSRDIYSEKVAPELLSVTGNPNAPYWSLAHGYDDDGLGRSSLDSYPFRVLGTGTKNGLQLALSLNRDDLDYMCEGPVQGFKVVFSGPAEIPLPSTNYFRVPLDQEVLVSVKPKKLETLPKLHNYLPDRRLCLMQSENRLKFFKVYTQRHCELECTSKVMNDKCHCVLFSYPRDKNTSICGIQQLACAIKIEGNMVENIFLESLDKSLKTKDKTCNCLPECTTNDYEIELSSAHYDAVKFLRALSDESTSSVDFDKIAYASLNIHFKEKQFFSSKRDELYGRTKLLAECGGILGLFIGVTALSFVEILYYFTLRLIWTLRMYRCGKSEDLPDGLVAASTTKAS